MGFVSRQHLRRLLIPNSKSAEGDHFLVVTFICVRLICWCVLGVFDGCLDSLARQIATLSLQQVCGGLDSHVFLSFEVKLFVLSY